ncbi:MAG TPA: hypothetical protein DCY13_01545 [Verrucomicrobiales bacterium]|nr:hypothetical protein [Verrucomicrobiales bacterium]
MQVLDHLKERGLRQDTIVIFQSDHGHSTEERAHFGGGSAGPYRGEKFSLFEGGIRVPAIISWPATLPAGETRDQFATGCDWFPTILQLTHTRPGREAIDGQSLFPVLWAETAPSPHRVFHWASGGGRDNRQWAVREGDWKLVVNGRGTEAGDKVFLSNLAESVTEKVNVAAGHPDMVERLTKLHEEWAAELGE